MYSELNPRHDYLEMFDSHFKLTAPLGKQKSPEFTLQYYITMTIIESDTNICEDHDTICLISFRNQTIQKFEY